MLRRLLRRVFVRMSSWYGVPTINQRLDRLEGDVESLEGGQGAFERFLDRRMNDLADDTQTVIRETVASLEERIEILESRLRDDRSVSSG